MAIERPHKGRWKAQQVAQVHVRVPRARMQPALQEALREISTVLAAQGIEPAGPWFTHHHGRPTEFFDFDVCFPVAQAIVPQGRVEPAQLPEFEVVRTAYHGPYEGLPAAWREFVAWVEAHGLETREDLIEVYSIGPQQNPSPEAWQTDLLYALASGEVEKERLV